LGDVLLKDREISAIGHDWHQHVTGMPTTCCAIWWLARTHLLWSKWFVSLHLADSR